MGTQAPPSMVGAWARKVSGLSTSTNSKVSFWARLRRPTDIEHGEVELEEDYYNAAKTRLFSVMTNKPKISPNHDTSDKNIEFQWYLKLLKSYFPSLATCIKLDGKDCVAEEDQTWYNTKSLELLEHLAQILTSCHTLPGLETIRLQLTSNPILASAVSIDAPHIIIFSMIGWLTMIYQPLQTFGGQETGEENSLTIALEDHQGGELQSDVYRQRSITLKEGKAVKIPLHHLFVQFGKLIPGRMQQSGPVTPNLHVDVFREQVVVSYLNFQTLYEVAKIRIVWVDCLSLHLDFQEKTKQLKVFRFPSFCKLMCQCMIEPEQGNQANSSSYLSSLFIGLFQTQITGTRESPAAQLCARDYYREALLTYRLLFGQDKKSWKAWKSYYSAQVDAFDAETTDPLLPHLCGKNCQDESTYSEIQASELGQQYSAQEDFPFFGDRLVKIQQFVLKGNPSDWKTLWNDRRDLLRFYTFWAVVIVGGASLFMSLIQNLEGVVQIVFAVKQSRSPISG